MNKFALANARRVNVAYSPDVTKATAVKTVKKLSVNNYTSRHISKGGQFLAFENNMHSKEIQLADFRTI